MKSLATLLSKTIRIGPLPYLALCIVILAIGVVLQLRSANPVMADGSTIFGFFARIGGLVGLFGLVPLIFAVREEGGKVDPEAQSDDPSGDFDLTEGRAREASSPRSLMTALLKRLSRRTA